MQCSSCVFCRDRECTSNNAGEEWLDMAETGECPGYYGRQDARDDAKLRFAEKG